MTKLKAVNFLLKRIGERPVNQLETTLSNALLAELELDYSNERIQLKGLHCNTEYNRLLPRDINDEYIIPEEILKIDASDSSLGVTQRGGKMYDKINGTYKFDQDLEFDFTVLLDFEDLPEYVAFYVVASAARTFSMDRTADTIRDRALAEQEALAQFDFQVGEEENEDNNMMNNYAVGRILDRMNVPYSTYGSALKQPKKT